MAGFFKDTSGLDANDFGSSNNAANDFARSGAAPSNLFDRIFGGPRGSGRITSQQLPPPDASPPPAISSAPALIQRVVQASSPPPPPAPAMPGPQAPPPFQRQQPVDQPPPLPPFQYPGAAVARAPVAPPPMTLPPFEYPGSAAARAPVGPAPDRPPSLVDALLAALQGGNQFGGNRFGGNQFGGNRFGGNQFGASALPAGAPAPEPPGAELPPLDMTALLPHSHALLSGLRHQTMRDVSRARGFFSGGYARGGYPELMGGLPQRRARGNYIEPDGQGDGRSDHVPAVLSPGEFVMDAETVSMLGNGDNDAGARRLEEMRQELRRHKGRALAKGKFSPDAKKPGKYLKGGKN